MLAEALHTMCLSEANQNKEKKANQGMVSGLPVSFLWNFKMRAEEKLSCNVI